MLPPLLSKARVVAVVVVPGVVPRVAAKVGRRLGPAQVVKVVVHRAAVARDVRAVARVKAKVLLVW